MSSTAPLEKLYVLLGDPVHHSLSPALQRAAFRAAGLDADYVALRAHVELVGPLMRELAALGGGGNVTVPHKALAARALDRASDTVRVTGACNVFWWDEDYGLCGDNTDVEAFLTAAHAVLGGELRGTRVLLLGAGGAARAVVHACLEAGSSGIDILNRSRRRAEELAERFDVAARLRVLPGREALASRSYDLVVNATSLGLESSDPLPLEPKQLRARALLDLVYSRDETMFVRAARDAGITAEDGRRMLVEQAAASFQRWFGREPPRGVMYEVLGLNV